MYLTYRYIPTYLGMYEDGSQVLVSNGLYFLYERARNSKYPMFRIQIHRYICIPFFLPLLSTFSYFSRNCLGQHRRTEDQPA